VQQFFSPLEAAGVDIANINEEWEDMINCARRYLNIASKDNQNYLV